MRLVPPGRTLIFSYIRRLGTFFWVQNFVSFQIFFFWGGGGSENYFFLGCEDFVDIFWGYSKIGLYLGVISMHFMVFS